MPSRISKLFVPDLSPLAIGRLQISKQEKLLRLVGLPICGLAPDAPLVPEPRHHQLLAQLAEIVGSKPSEQGWKVLDLVARRLHVPSTNDAPGMSERSDAVYRIHQFIDIRQ